jgi:hypothetical protein
MEDTVTSCLLFCYLPRKLQEVTIWLGCEKDKSAVSSIVQNQIMASRL